MTKLTTPKVESGKEASAFNLLSAHDNNHYNLEDFRNQSGLVVAFICNHCPYVKAIVKRMAGEAKKMQEMGIGFIAINANDAIKYPDDSFEMMTVFAMQYKFSFPYLHDATQKVATQYGAICTPDIFGFDSKLKLRYRGRFDEHPFINGQQRKNNKSHNSELFRAMQDIVQYGEYQNDQIASIGCSIKWAE